MKPAPSTFAPISTVLAAFLCCFAVSLKVHAQTTINTHPGYWTVYSSIDDPSEVDRASDAATACQLNATQFGDSNTPLIDMTPSTVAYPARAYDCWFYLNGPLEIFLGKWAGTGFKCPSGYIAMGDVCVEVEHSLQSPNTCHGTDSENGQQAPTSGDHPVLFALGGKFGHFIDYEMKGARPWLVSRSYRSISATSSEWSHGFNWRNNFEHTLTFSNNTQSARPGNVWYIAPDGAVYKFADSGGASYTGPGNLLATLTAVPATTYETNYEIWRLTFEDGRVLEFRRGAGDWPQFLSRIESITWPDGYQRRYLYKNLNARFTKIIDTDGRWAEFDRTDYVINKITMSDGAVIDYGYDAHQYSGQNLNGTERLISATVTAPGETARTETYHYEHARRYLVTRVTDANGDDSHVWAYNSNGRAISSARANGADSYSVTYDDANGKRTVTNALGKSAVYHFDHLDGRYQTIKIEGQASANCAAADVDYGYDANGLIDEITDGEGNITTYVKNARGLETSRTEASGTAEARTTTTTWHSSRNLPTQVAGPKLTTDYTYGTDAELLSITATDKATSDTRTWAYGYQAADAAPQAVPLTILNNGAELTNTLWTHVNGGFWDNSWSVFGVHSFNGSPNSNPRANQLVDIPSQYHSDVDAGKIIIRYTFWQRAKSGGDDIGWTQIAFRDGSNNWLTDYTVITPKDTPGDWLKRVVFAEVPAGTREIQLQMYCKRKPFGQICDAYFDHFLLDLFPMKAKPRLLTSVDGPLPGTGDTVNYAYDANGWLSSVTNELGHVTDILAVNDNGQPTEIEDPNGVTTDIAYDGEGRVETITVNSSTAATTTIAYDPIGLITRITPADGAYLDYEYDDARRVTRITNAANEKIEYQYNALGNVTKIDVKSSSGSIMRTQSRTYDELGRVMKLIGADFQETLFAYDRNDNVDSVTDPRSGLFDYSYDALNRLIKETDPDLGETEIDFDANDALTSVEDAENLSTTYTRNGFGEVTQLVSPDTGTTTYEYDERGLVTKMTDARGKVTDYAYDDAGRLLSETYPTDANSDVFYAYDSGGGSGIGRLASVTDAPGSASYAYDERGNVTSETRIIGLQSYTTAYQYNVGDRTTRITYPSGRIVDISRDSAGRISAITTKDNSGAPTQNVLTGISYFPMADESSLWGLTAGTFGNGLSLAIGHDDDGRLETLDVTGLSPVEDLTFAYDDNGNITSITDAVNSSRSESFQYDALDRLTQAVGLYGTIDYVYDLVGNRTSRVLTGGTSGTETYTYSSTAHQLLSVAKGGTTRNMTYAASGQLATDASGGVTRSYAYDDSGRMVDAKDNGVTLADYVYDAWEQRASKAINGGATIHYVYDLDGRLIAEHDGGTGAALREYMYIGLTPVGYVDHSGANPVLYYMHTDQVMRPRKLTDASKAVVWDRVATPFGEEHSVTGSLTQLLEFPGQTNDSETGLFQNWHREYDPSFGRYVQSDPIGLIGGVNTYAYVKGNPLRYIDQTGEFIILAIPFTPQIVAGVVAATAAIGAAVYIDQSDIGEDFGELIGSLGERANDNTPKGFCTLVREFPPVSSCENRICQYQCRDGHKFTTEQAGRNFTCAKTALDPRGF